MKQDIQKKYGAEGSVRKNWESIYTQWKVSGLSQGAFCKNKGIKSSSFSYWVNKFNKQPAAVKKVGAINFAQVDKAILCGQDAQIRPVPATVDLSLTICGMKFKFNDQLSPEKLRTYLMVLRG